MQPMANLLDAQAPAGGDHSISPGLQALGVMQLRPCPCHLQIARPCSALSQAERLHEEPQAAVEGWATQTLSWHTEAKRLLKSTAAKLSSSSG